MPTPREIYNAKDVAATAGLLKVLTPKLGENAWLYLRLMDLQRALMVPQVRGWKVDARQRDQEHADGQRDLEELAGKLVGPAQSAWESPDIYIQWATGPSAKLLTKKGEPTALAKRLRSRYETQPLAGATGKGAISRDILRYLLWGHLNLKGLRGVTAEGKLTNVAKGAATLWKDIPVHKKRKLLKGKRFSVDAEALEKIDHPVVALVLQWYALDKGLSFLMAKLTPEDRYRCVYSVGSTKTFRLSCKKNMFDEGGNLQQIPKNRRQAFVADTGNVLITADYTSAESHILSAFVGGDYWKVHEDEEEDTHLLVGKLMGLDLPRQTLKMIQHAKNYMQSSHGMARGLGVTVKEAEEYEGKYFSAFPEIPGIYHKWIAASQRKGEILVPCYGKWLSPYWRKLWGEDIKDVAAHPCQSLLALITHTALVRLVKKEPEVQVLHHNHDELVVQVPKGEVENGIRLVEECMKVPVEIEDRVLVLRTKTEVGPNWGSCE